MDGLPEAPASGPAAGPYTRITSPGLFTGDRSSFGDGRCELVSCLAGAPRDGPRVDRRGSGNRGKSPGRDETETGRRGMRGKAWRGASHLSEFLVAWKGLATAVWRGRGWVLW